MLVAVFGAAALGFAAGGAMFWKSGYKSGISDAEKKAEGEDKEKQLKIQSLRPYRKP